MENLKRPNSDGDESASKRLCTPLVRQKPKQKLELMTLPIEIRWMILRRMLVLSEPVGRDSDSGRIKDVMALLSTCRQIRKDGLPIFVEENTFDITIYEGSINAYVLGHKIMGERPFPSVLTTVRSVRIVLKPWEENITWEDSVVNRRSVHAVCQTMVQHLNMSLLSIHIVVEDRWFADYNSDDDSILDPLAYLRGVRNVRIEGLFEEYKAAELREKMMMPGQIENIWEMRRAYAIWILQWRDYADQGAMDDIQSAWNHCYIQEFKDLRDDLIEEVRGNHANAFERSVQSMLNNRNQGNIYAKAMQKVVPPKGLHWYL